MFSQDSSTPKKQMNTYRKNFLLIVTGFVIFVWALFAVSSGASDLSVNLMRLNLSQTGGTVKVEITGDKPVTNFRIKQLDNKIVVQIKSARSRLQSAYQVHGSFVDEVQAVAKEFDGAAVVEFIINTQQGATATSVTEFNKLIIFVDSSAPYKTNESFSFSAKDRPITGSQSSVQYKAKAMLPASNRLPIATKLTSSNVVKKAANENKVLPSAQSTSFDSQRNEKNSFSQTQQENGSLNGQIKDELGGVIVNADVVVTDKNGQQRTVRTNQDGIYRFTNLTPGKYILRVASTGFTQYESQVNVIANKPQNSLNIALKVNDLDRQEVTVAVDTPLNSDLENNASGIVLRDEELNSLPEDPQGLANALQILSAASGNPTGGEVIVDGFSGSRIPPKKAIREIRINKNPYTAEFNQPGNGRIEILTKPGMEEFHGGAYFEFNNNKLNTRNPFASTTTPYQSNYYNVYLGGPVLRNRLSFFFNFDKGKTDSNSLINARILDSNLNIVPFSSTVSNPQGFTGFTPRFDLKLNNNNTLVGRYNFTKSSSVNSGVGGFSLLSRAYKTSGIEQTLHLTETAVLNQRTVSETRFQFVNKLNKKQSNNFGVTVDVPGAFTGGGTPFDNISDRYNRSEISNVTTLSLKNHTIRTGAGFRYVNITDWSTQGFGGSYRFDGSLAPQLDNNNQIVYGANGQPVIIPITGLERYWRTLMFSQLGFSSQEIRNLGGGATQFNITTGNPEARVGQHDVYAFVQDDWRLRPNFTLGLGLRYESQSNINGKLNFAPRVSFAWSKMGKANKSKGKNKGEKQINFAVRGGVGVFYERLGEGFTLRANRLNGINQRQYIVTDSSVLDLFPQIPSVDTLAGLSNTSSTVRQASDLRVPYSIQSTISFEKQLPLGFVLSTTYLNTRTMNALRSRYSNSPTNGIGQTDKIFQYESSGTFQQNQLSFTATKRLKNSSIYATYSLRKAKSDTDGADTLAQDSSNFENEYSRASTDIRHNLYIGGWFRPFYNIDINPFIIYRSGIPYNITTGRDSNGDTFLTERPSFATDLNRPSVVVTSMGAFDLDPIPGQIIIPRNYGTSPSFFSVNTRIGKTIAFNNKLKSQNPFYLTISVQLENLFNSTNAYIPEGNLSSPLFGRPYSPAGAYGFGAYVPGNRIIKPQVTFNF